MVDSSILLVIYEIEIKIYDSTMNLMARRGWGLMSWYMAFFPNHKD